MKRTMTDLYRGSMRGRTMYVIPFVMGPVEAETPMFGVEITDSPYVVASMRIMTRMGTRVLEAMGDNADFVHALHSIGAPLAPGQQDVAWPCNETKYISHFPETREIWSYGSGYGGNSLLGKKCYSLRIATAMGRDEGWLAEHMLILKLTSPEGEVLHRGRLPVRLRQDQPGHGGADHSGLEGPDDRRRHRLDAVWRRTAVLYAVNPEYGLFGVAPGTDWKTNANAMRTLDRGNSIFTNVGLTDDGDIWWEGMGDPPAHLIDWKGNDWTPESDSSAFAPELAVLHPDHAVPDPRRRSTTTRNGVPIDAILFGGRRKDTIPLVTEARDWVHGVYMGATLSSETTAAAAGAGRRRAA